MLRLVFIRRETDDSRVTPGEWLYYKLEPADAAAPPPAELEYNVITARSPAGALLSAMSICERRGWLLVGVDYGPDGRIRT